MLKIILDSQQCTAHFERLRRHDADARFLTRQR